MAGHCMPEPKDLFFLKSDKTNCSFQPTSDSELGNRSSINNDPKEFSHVSINLNNYTQC